MCPCGAKITVPEINQPETASVPKTKRFSSRDAGFAVAIIVVILIAVFTRTSNRETSTIDHPTVAENNAPAVENTAVSDPLEMPTKSNENASNWKYNSSPEQMGRGEIKSAICTSTNTLSFKFPYAGAQNARLALRSHPQYGKDVIFRIEKGQFLTGVEGTNVLVQFDDNEPETFGATGPADYSTTSLFIKDSSRFISKLINSKIIKIQATFYNEGDQILEFTTAGLNWQE
jgi:hypothetical protein